MPRRLLPAAVNVEEGEWHAAEENRQKQEAMKHAKDPESIAAAKFCLTMIVGRLDSHRQPDCFEESENNVGVDCIQDGNAGDR